MNRPLFLLTFSLCLASYSQPTKITVRSAGGIYNFKHYTSEEGLLGSTTEYIFQDSKGYIWVGTRSGLNRLDGFEIQNFDETDGLVYRSIHYIIEDEHGILWMATERGLSSYDGFEFTNYSVEDGLVNQQIWCLAEHRDGGVLIGTSMGVDLFRNGKIEHYLDLDAIQAEKRMIRSLNYDSDGNLWIGSNKEVWRFKEKEGEKMFNLGIAVGFAEANDGTFWFGGWGKIMHYDDGVIAEYDFGTPIMSIATDKRGNLWLGSWNYGLIKFDGDTTAYGYGESEGLGLNTLWNVMVDREGTVWCASYGSGVSQLVDERFSRFTTANGMSNDVISGMVKDSAGNLWVASMGGVTMFGKNGEIIQINEKDGLSTLMVQNITLDPDGHIWFILYGGAGSIFEYDGQKLIQHPHSGGFGLHVDSRGGLWWGSDGGGARRYYEGSGKGFRSTKNPGRQRAMTFYEDSKANIWMGMQKRSWQVYSYETDSLQTDLFPGGLNKEAGLGGIEDYQGYYWFGLVDHGIYRCSFENNKFEILDSIKVEDGLMDAKFADFLPEGQGFWISSQKGITYLDLNTYYQEKRISLKKYNRDQGLIGEATGLLHLSENELAIGTNKGLLIFHKNEDRILDTPPITQITKVKLNKRDTDWSVEKVTLKRHTDVPEKLELPYDKNHLTFSFIGISFSAPERVRYRFILENFDSDWSPVTDQKEIIYSNIPPGEYTFKVESMNKDGVWDDSPDTIELIINPPFWQTWIFRISMGIILIYFAYLILRWRTRKLERAKKKLELRVAHRTSQLQSAFDQIEEKNREITDSISYAKRIQKAILPPISYAKERLGECFILYLPKDIVAGDFYWINRIENKTLFAVGDCTGHGVPGAMVSVVCHGALNRSVREFRLDTPAKILEKTREIVLETFEKSEEDVKDGMDIALCSLDRENGILEYAGAHNNLYIVQPNGEMFEVKADKQPIGKYEFAKAFQNHLIKIESGSSIYIFSDGYPDQFGGEKGKKFKYKSLKNLLVQTSHLLVEEQGDELLKQFEAWKGDLEQVDDVCIIGLRI